MLKDKIAIVTGGATGLGKAVVKKFVDSGCKVVFTYLKSEEKAKYLMEKYPGVVYGIKADATSNEEAKKVVEKTIEIFGDVHILVNNSYAAKDAPIWDHTYDKWDFTIKNTLYSCFNYTNAISNHFIKNNYGKIINIGSINGVRGREGSIAYCSAKAAIIGFTKTVAKELGRYNICANVINPGYIDTEAQVNTSQIIKKLVLDECAIKKLTQPEEVAELIEFIASSKSDSITGQVYTIDRGQYI